MVRTSLLAARVRRVAGNSFLGTVSATSIPRVSSPASLCPPSPSLYKPPQQTNVPRSRGCRPPRRRPAQRGWWPRRRRPRRRTRGSTRRAEGSPLPPFCRGKCFRPPPLGVLEWRGVRDTYSEVSARRIFCRAARRAGRPVGRATKKAWGPRAAVSLAWRQTKKVASGWGG